MKWMQFFTPVSSINWDEAQQLVVAKGQDQVIFLDVRQPSEYQAGHLPGAKLLPVGELEERLDELDRQKDLIIY
jgi:rhodanese-related sulfurtransferase